MKFEEKKKTTVDQKKAFAKIVMDVLRRIADDTNKLLADGKEARREALRKDPRVMDLFDEMCSIDKRRVAIEEELVKKGMRATKGYNEKELTLSTTGDMDEKIYEELTSKFSQRSKTEEDMIKEVWLAETQADLDALVLKAQAIPGLKH